MDNDTINQTFARLRQLYPDDVKQIEAEQDRVTKLLKEQEYAEQEGTKELVRLCRADILRARILLSTDRTLDDKARAELWAVVDSRQWFLKMVVKDFVGELASIQAQLEADLGV